jgi:hypothetical protein
MMVLIFGVRLAVADEPSLMFEVGDGKHSFTASELLARPDAAELAIPNDASYGRATRYRAVPLLPLLAGLQDGRNDTLEARSTDGFVAQIPFSLIRRGAEGYASAETGLEVTWAACRSGGHDRDGDAGFTGGRDVLRGA